VLAIGYTRSAIFSILPRAIRAFRVTHPDVKIEWVTMLSEYQYEQLLNGRIQVGISRYFGKVDSVEGLSFTPLLDDPFVVALSRAHPLAKRKSLRARELDALPYIAYPKDPQSRFAEQTLAALRKAGGQSNVAHEANDIHTALGMVASGLGFCLAGRSVSEGNRDDITFIRVTDIRETATVVAVTKLGETSKIVSSFVDVLVGAVAGPGSTRKDS
jgi:LysR family transcriptional regulator, benzoate and cis,cis-muconate-responsive activator of ben and cat genes